MVGSTITMIREFMWDDPDDSWTYAESYIAVERMDVNGDGDTELVMLRAAACCNTDHENTLGFDIVSSN